MTAGEPALRFRAAAGTTGLVVLVLYGGKADSHAASRPWHLSAVRMAPFARGLARWGVRRGVTVATLRYRFRGWNGAEASPVADGRWALERIRSRYGDVPVVLVGHSMGGRAAFHLAGEPTVVGIVGLAPWLTEGEPVAATAGRAVLIVHGTADRWTDPGASREYAAAALKTGAAEVAWVPLEGIGHFMLRRPRRWRRLTTNFLERRLGDSGQTGNITD